MSGVAAFVHGTEVVEALCIVHFRAHAEKLPGFARVAAHADAFCTHVAHIEEKVGGVGGFECLPVQEFPCFFRAWCMADAGDEVTGEFHAGFTHAAFGGSVHPLVGFCGVSGAAVSFFEVEGVAVHGLGAQGSRCRGFFIQCGSLSHGAGEVACLLRAGFQPFEVPFVHIHEQQGCLHMSFAGAGFQQHGYALYVPDGAILQRGFGLGVHALHIP